MDNKLDALDSIRKYSIVIVLIVLFIIFSIFAQGFLSSTNVLNVLRQYSMLGIIACGMTLLMIAGGFDLSVGANMAFTGIILTYFTNWFGYGMGLFFAMEL
jgi:ribose/xylose/arabinose/galactoside ABC-type transport system permease subunit